MINTKFLLLASACVLLSGSSQASEAENLTFSYSGSLLVNTYTLTPHTPMELKPISSLDNLAKLAAVCALGGGGCSGMSFGSSGNSTGLDTGSQCKDEGFVQSCPAGYVKDVNNICPHNPSYFKCRKADDSCKSGYSPTECDENETLVGSYQNEAGNTCYQCFEKPDDVKCEEKGFVKTCPDGQVKDEKNLCPDNSAYFKCREAKNTCDNGYALTACSSEQIQTDSYINEAKNTCYICRDKTCTEGGYKDAVPSGQSCSPVTYYGRNCFKNCKTTITTLPILYSDKTVSASIISGKTPIGVVFDSNRRLAVALNQSSTTFGGYETEITNLENCYIGRDMTSCGSDGKTNTAKIIQAGKENNISYPAAEYCYKYTTAGTKVGDWFLPSVNELKNICDVKENINATLNLLGKSPFTPEGKSYWSSTGYSNFYSWTFYLAVCSAGDNQHHRGTNLSVRPIIQY